jgi:hypothetical protein
LSVPFRPDVDEPLADGFTGRSYLSGDDATQGLGGDVSYLLPFSRGLGGRAVSRFSGENESRIILPRV